MHSKTLSPKRKTKTNYIPSIRESRVCRIEAGVNKEPPTPHPAVDMSACGTHQQIPACGVTILFLSHCPIPVCDWRRNLGPPRCDDLHLISLTRWPYSAGREDRVQRRLLLEPRRRQQGCLQVPGSCLLLRPVQLLLPSLLLDFLNTTAV